MAENNKIPVVEKDPRVSREAPEAAPMENPIVEEAPEAPVESPTQVATKS
jgi:hypothetical protein